MQNQAHVSRSLTHPIIGKLLGHTQASTTQRYAHLDADPLRRASDAIGGRIAAALDGTRGKVLTLTKVAARAIWSARRAALMVGATTSQRLERGAPPTR